MQKEEIDDKNKEIMNSLTMKESLLKEIHHRVKNNLQIDQRKEQWISDGIQVFMMMRYINAFHPEMKMTGNLAKLKLLKSYHFINLDFNQQYNYLYLLMARKNLDQPLSFPKNRLIKFNEQIANKYKAGLSLQYLDAYLGNDIVEKYFWS